MANKKIKNDTPTPKSDPRGYSEMRGAPMDVKDHPTYNKPDATEHYDGEQLKGLYDSMGPKTTYQQETRSMSSAVDISENVPRRGE